MKKGMTVNQCKMFGIVETHFRDSLENKEKWHSRTVPFQFCSFSSQVDSAINPRVVSDANRSPNEYLMEVCMFHVYHVLVGGGGGGGEKEKPV